MKIIHCLIQYFPLHVAGTEVYTHTLACMQKKQGHEVAVITTHIEHYHPGKINPHYVYDTVDVYQFMETANPLDRNILSGKKKPDGLQNFHQLLQTLQPDIVHFQELNRSIGFTSSHVKVARDYGAKVFITMHLSFYTCFTNRLVVNNQLCKGVIKAFECSACIYNSMFNIPATIAKPLASLALALNKSGVADALPPSKFSTLALMPVFVERIKRELAEISENTHQIISVTKWYRDILLMNGVPPNKITLIPQAIALSEKNNTYTNNVPTKTTPPLKVVFLGRIQTQKGVHLLIEAVRQFSETELLLDFYGKEETTEYYQKCIKDTATLPNVRWKGMIERDKVVEMLSAYDVLCLPSVVSEMSPLVIQEAFAAGIPVLASTGYGNMEQIEDGVTGLLFNFNDVKSLTTKLQLLISEPLLLEKMKKQVPVPGSFEGVASRYEKLYQSFLT